MAQNEGMEAAGRGGTSGSSESTGSKAGTETASQVGGITGREPTQQGSRLSRREGWEDQFTSFFGGSPFALFRRLSDDMDRLFFGGSQGLSTLAPFAGRFMPHIDVEERDDRIVVRADLPGCRPEDFHVDIEDEALVIQGERRSQQEETRGGIRRSERSYGNFRRVIPLPPGANAEAADARFENGVLEIDIPVQQQSRSRRVEVRSGTSGGTSGSTSSEPTHH
jgi:HSP20 family protein